MLSLLVLAVGPVVSPPMAAIIVANKPRANPEQVVRLFSAAASYPKAALKAGVEGAVVAELAISKSGKVERCTVVASAHDLLGEPTCKVARRLIFMPATDAGGNAIPGPFMLRVRWQLPEKFPPAPPIHTPPPPPAPRAEPSRDPATP